MKKKLGVCAIFKDEAAYLKEWVEFHRLMGVEQFYLYNNCSTDNYLEVLASIEDRGDIRLIDWERTPGQLSAYNHCAFVHGPEVEWLAFIDLDEFLFATGGVSLPDFLLGYTAHAGVGANWVMFGSSGHQTPPVGGVLENYRLRGSLDVVIPYPSLLAAPATATSPALYRLFNSHIKSIVRPELIDYCPNPHYFVYRVGSTCVSENHEPIVGPFSASVSVSKLRINHYWSKSAQECRQKIMKGKADIGGYRRWEEFLVRDQVLNTETDTVILNCIEQMKKV